MLYSMHIKYNGILLQAYIKIDKKCSLDAGYNRFVHAMNSACRDSDNEVGDKESFESTCVVTASIHQENAPMLTDFSELAVDRQPEKRNRNQK